MKRLGSILLVAGCLSGTLQPYAQEYPAGPLYDTPDELSFKARAAARTLLFKELEPLSLQWLREEANPLLRARRKLRQAIPKRDLSKEVGLWRMSVGNTSADNWSPYPDRALDARTLRFPLPRDSRADKRPDNLKALDRMRQQKR